MNKVITIGLLTIGLNASSCNIEYYKMASNRDDIKRIEKSIEKKEFKKVGCIGKGDCITSLKSLKELDDELAKKYYDCKYKRVNN